MRKYYPVFMTIEGRKCVVVGGGDVAARKAKSLADAGGRVKVVSPQLCQRLSRLAETGRVKLDRREFQARDLDGAFLAIACTSDRNVNDRVYAAAERRRIPVNVVDSIRLCDFIVPSVVSRGALTIAVSTSGISPALSRKIREELGRRYGRAYADFLALMEESRQEIVRKVLAARKRRKIFDALTDEKFIAGFLRSGTARGKRLFKEKMRKLLSRMETGHV